MLFRDENPILGPLTVIDWAHKSLITQAVYHADATDTVLLCNYATGNQDIILPSKNVPVGKVFVIKLAGAGSPVNVTVDNGANIDALSDGQLQLLTVPSTTANGSHSALQWDGTQYWIVG